MERGVSTREDSSKEGIYGKGRNRGMDLGGDSGHKVLLSIIFHGVEDRNRKLKEGRDGGRITIGEKMRFMDLVGRRTRADSRKQRRIWCPALGLQCKSRGTTWDSICRRRRFEARTRSVTFQKTVQEYRGGKLSKKKTEEVFVKRKKNSSVT